MIKKKQESIICPFCCHKFHPNEADFRLSSPITPNDEKGNKKPATSGMELDNKLYEYNLKILNNHPDFARKNAIKFLAFSLHNESVSYNQDDIAKYGFVQHITYTSPQGLQIISDIRLCPNCHNGLPTGYGMRDTLLVSILGDARAGKSVFLTMLIAELENNSDFVSKLTFIGDKQVKDNFYENYQKPLFKEHTLISSTKRRKIPPYSFNYWYQYKDESGVDRENAIDIIFYDIAGEDLRDEVGIRKNGFNIKDSSGLIFLVDPTNFCRLTDLFRLSDAALIDAIPEDNSTQTIFNTLYNYFIGFEKDKSNIPLALVLSKSDLFRYIHFDYFNNKPENRIQYRFPEEAHRGAINMRCVKGLNQEVRELLSYLGEDSIINNALGCFKTVTCFAASSLGKKPTVEQISDPLTNETIEKGFIDGPLLPFRVKEAFYWILMRNQLLYKYENNHYIMYGESDEIKKDNNQLAKTAKIKSTSPTLWVRISNFFSSLIKRREDNTITSEIVEISEKDDNG